MPSFGTINNGESGSSVRTKLNNVINYVNTGTTLSNVLSLGNNTNGENIVVTDGDVIYGDNLTLSSNTSTQITSTNGNTYGEFDTAVGSASVEASDGTNYANIIFSTTDATIEVSDGTTLSQQINTPNTIELTSSILGITDRLKISPDSNIDNSKFRSEFSGGGYSQYVMTYDNPSWECSDGGTNNVSITLATTNINLSAGDGVDTTTFTQTPTSITTNLSGIGDYKVNGNNYDGINTGSTEFGIYNGYGWGVYVADNGGNGATSIDIPYDNSTADIIFYPVTGKIKFDGGVNDLLLECTNVPSYDDDASAGTGGLTIGQIYQTTGNGAAPLDVAGILMIKQ